MLRKAVCVGLILFAPGAFSGDIGRIGNKNRLQDRGERYSTALPESFASVSRASDGGVILASGLFVVSPPMPLDLQVLPFRTQYPKLRGRSIGWIESYFLQSPGIRYELVAVNNGALNLLGENATGYVGISVCGSDRGYVVLGLKNELVREAIHKMLNDTVFDLPCSTK